MNSFNNCTLRNITLGQGGLSLIPSSPFRSETSNVFNDSKKFTNHPPPAIQFVRGMFGIVCNPQYNNFIGQIIDYDDNKRKVTLKIFKHLDLKKILQNSDEKQKKLDNNEFKVQETNIKISWVRTKSVKGYRIRNEKYKIINNKTFLYKRFMYEEVKQIGHQEFRNDFDIYLFEKNMASFEKNNIELLQGFNIFKDQLQKKSKKIEDYFYIIDKQEKKIPPIEIQTNNIYPEVIDISQRSREAAQVISSMRDYFEKNGDLLLDFQGKCINEQQINKDAPEFTHQAFNVWTHQNTENSIANTSNSLNFLNSRNE